MDSFATFLMDYESRYHQHRLHLQVNHSGNKHIFVLDALQGVIQSEHLEKKCKACEDKEGDADFGMVSLIRLLYLGDKHHRDRRNQINQIDRIDDTTDNTIILDHQHELDITINRILVAFDKFGNSFWPETGKSFPDSMVFWSENHIIMLLSSAYLYRQWLQQRLYLESSQVSLDSNAASSSSSSSMITMPEYIPTSTAAVLEFKVLKAYLRAHILMARGRTHSMFEVLSHVYLPHSLCGLFNLFDFAEDVEIKDLARGMINDIMGQLMLCTTDKSVANLSASCRSFVRTRCRTHGHNVNQLINLMTGHSPDPVEPSALSDFLFTTNWRPVQSAFDAWRFIGFQSLWMNPGLNEIHSVFSPEMCELPEAELTPFFWSAGLVSHPDFAHKTKDYINLKKMSHNTHLWPLQFLSPSIVEMLMTSYSEVSSGQIYAGVKLCVYKQPGGLMLSSFENFNAPNCAFQQLPWMANIDGVGVWSQSGGGSESIAGFGMSNTHNPAIKQCDGLLVAAYYAPSVLRNSIGLGSFLAHQIRMFWPKEAFEETIEESLADVTEREKAAGSASSSKRRGWRSYAMGLVGVDTTNSNIPANSWWVGKRNASYIGIMCSKETTKETKGGKNTQVELARGVSHTITRRVCQSHSCFWIVKVASTSQYATLADFLVACSEGISARHEKRAVVGPRDNVSSSSSGVGNQWVVSVVDQTEAYITSDSASATAEAASSSSQRVGDVVQLEVSIPC